jgi:hypothetical protein
LSDLIRSWEPEHQDLARRIGIVLLASVVVDLLGSVLILHFERGAAGSQIGNFGDSIFWVTTQLLTVSSQLPNPVTTGGRLVDVFLEIYAVVVVTTIAGTWSSYFHRRSMKRHGVPKQAD